MELDANGLTVLIILGFALWKVGRLLEDLERRATQQLHKATVSSDKAGGPARAAPGDGDKSERTTPPAAASPPDKSVSDRLNDIALADPAFEPSWFLDSARIVYETVVAAFANGDREVLQELLAANVYDTFAAEIAFREAKGRRVAFTFIGLKRADIVDAGVFNGQAQITVDFESELVTATYDPAGRVVDGDPTRVTVASDRWTFAKDLSSHSPVWKLIATESPADVPPPRNKQEQNEQQSTRQLTSHES